ncbi:hypothetical protein [Streptomyces sp900116325]|uniref:Uncharacterized protein n=1 Tax=Streptomyces sp. 900116325 TaxID=3154295 RepID=A0ABV2UCD1_9ACTN
MLNAPVAARALRPGVDRTEGADDDGGADQPAGRAAGRGAHGPHAVPYRGAACPVRLLSLLDGTDVTAVRELHARVSGVWNHRPWAGRRTSRRAAVIAPKHHDERARKRPAGLVSQCDPASLFGTVHESA